MKYLVNRETKEHIVFHADLSVPYPQWSIVEADSEGWITWEGGECPLPASNQAEVMLRDGKQGSFDSIPLMTYRNWQKWNCGGDIIAYRPILETAEKEEPRRHGRTIVYIPESQKSVFDRLKSAIAASESIPAIIAEIDALLPEGYFVSKTLTGFQESIGTPLEPAEDMSDWRNWKEGDLVTAHGLRGGYSENDFPENVPRTIVAKCLSGLDVKSSNGNVLYFHCMEISRGELKFHSRPAKATE